MSPATEEDPRRAKSRARVLHAAVELLRVEGLAGLTIEAVAARSGVAKTTIYRQFADSEALHVAAVDTASCPVEMRCTADLISDVTSYCQGLAAKLREGEFGGLLSTAVDGAERSASLASIMRGISAERRRALSERLRSALTDGSLSAGTDVDVLTGQLVGPIFYRRFFSREPIGAAYVARNVAAVLTPLVSRTPAPTASRGSGGPPRSSR